MGWDIVHCLSLCALRLLRRTVLSCEEERIIGATDEHTVIGERISECLSLAEIDPLLLYGSHDANLVAIEGKFGIKVVARGEKITLEGDREAVGKAADLLRELVMLIKRGSGFDEADFRLALDYAAAGTPSDIAKAHIVLSAKKRIIRPKSLGQSLYVDAIRRHDIVFGIGPAGTGKTYLSVAMAVATLKEGEVSKIVLTRPAVEAGESLGFLPGDPNEKVEPYLRPLYDALNDMMPPERIQRLSEQKLIEVVPLAYMRGRTLGNAFVILDEAQNTTPMQMKMFLTRLGVHSKAVITGDVTQADLPGNSTSGLVQIQDILSNVEGVRFIYLTERDVVRHRLVKEIIKAYDAYHLKRET
jgi:phosphate starvation-inducible PhoH-like protein